MRTIRVLLLISLIPFAPKLGKYVAVGYASADAVWSEQTLSPRDRNFRQTTDELVDLHELPGDPLPGDWRSTVVQPAQTFAQYAQSNPVRPDAVRQTIYVQPIGAFTKPQREIVTLSAEFLGLYYSAPVRMLPDVAESAVPARARRRHPQTGQEQFLPAWINSEYLKPRLPEDAVACIALTATDLWPGKNWNFVFGQASLVDRVGVWSIARHGDPADGVAEYVQCLHRAVKTAVHETGHMYSMQHCLHFNCVMAGSGSLEEGDRHPLYLCPECLAKLHWNVFGDLEGVASATDDVRGRAVKRFRDLAEFCGANGLLEDEEYYRVAARRLER